MARQFSARDRGPFPEEEPHEEEPTRVSNRIYLRRGSNGRMEGLNATTYSRKRGSGAEERASINEVEAAKFLYKCTRRSVT